MRNSEGWKTYLLTNLFSPIWTPYCVSSILSEHERSWDTKKAHRVNVSWLLMTSSEHRTEVTEWLQEEEEAELQTVNNNKKMISAFLATTSLKIVKPPPLCPCTKSKHILCEWGEQLLSSFSSSSYNVFSLSCELFHINKRCTFAHAAVLNGTLPPPCRVFLPSSLSDRVFLCEFGRIETSGWRTGAGHMDHLLLQIISAA